MTKDYLYAAYFSFWLATFMFIVSLATTSVITIIVWLTLGRHYIYFSFFGGAVCSGFFVVYYLVSSVVNLTVHLIKDN
jgi:hypothetical protein